MRGPTPGFTGHLVTAVAGIAAATAVFLYLFIGGGGVDVKEKYRLNAVVPTV
jgi:hypothetical protein